MTRLLALLAALCLVIPGLTSPARAEIHVTDLAGREVVLEHPARRLVLGEARHLAVLALLSDDPVSMIAGWRQNKVLDPATLAAYRAKFPALDSIAPIGAGNRDISVESVIALAPDLVVLPLSDAKAPALEQARSQLEAAGIPVVYVDFFLHPQENTLPSLAILGALTGTAERAAEFAEFYSAHLSLVRSRLAAAGVSRPDVFMQVHAQGSDCCFTVGTGVFNDFIETAGGHNIGADLIDGATGKVSLEALIARDPAYFVATGGLHMAARGGLVIGAGVDPAQVRASFAALLQAPGISSLSAVAEGQVAAAWHLFNDTPSHIVLIEYLAKWLHPDLFGDLDPEATLREIETRFLPVQVPGTYWLEGRP